MSATAPRGEVLRPLFRMPLAPLLLLLALPNAAPAQDEAGESNCRPCVVLENDQPAAVAQLLGDSLTGEEGGTLYLASREDLAAPRSDDTWQAIEAAGARPWVRVRLETSAPLLQNAAALEAELEQLATLARRVPRATFQIEWPGLADPTWPQEYAFLIKRAGVVIAGAAPDAKVMSATLQDLDLEALEAFFAEETAAYIDGFVVRRLTDVAPLAEALGRLDPGAGAVLHAGDLPADATEVMALVAEGAASGASHVIVRDAEVDAEELRPLQLLARELRGDIEVDPYSNPEGAPAWTFVRGEDLALRVIARTGQGATLSFSDRQLTSPAQYAPSSLTAEPLFSGRRTQRGYELDLEGGQGVVMLRLERNLAQLEGRESEFENLTVETVRQMPVEEILRRLQASEDAQGRRLDSYTGYNTMSMRFLLGNAQAIDVQFEGQLYQAQGQPADWAWQELFINGVRWRGKRLPEIPLIQPEKAAALPLLISFTKEYRYRLRGTATVQGRDCWVVDFEPAVALEEGRSLFQGTVWVDRELYVRVKTQAVQLGLTGDAISNEEIIFYQPVDDDGQATEWSRTAYVLPLRLVGQQLFSIISATTVVEREINLTQLQINPADFEERRQELLASDTTIVRDTARGFRYLVEDKETGQRVVQEELDPSRFFLVGGVFWDESQDFPLPLAGLNWLSLDFRGTGAQTNFFFAGPLLMADIAKPSIFGSRFDVGLDVFGLFVAGTDSIFRDDREAEEEDIETLRPNLELTVGRRFGSFFKLDFEYQLASNNFSSADDTAEDFVIPEDHLSHAFELTARYNRRGYRFRLGGSHHLRGDWQPWGFEGNPDFAPDKDEYQRWGAALQKIWHLPKFQKVGAEIEYVGGNNLDRFSKYQFGFFSGIRVHGYRQDRIRAEEASALHLSYGFELGELFRLDLVGDVASATDEASGLDNEILAGVGLVGTFIGPWQTVVNVDVGVPVAGPDEGFSAFIAFLKLFR